MSTFKRKYLLPAFEDLFIYDHCFPLTIFYTFSFFRLLLRGSGLVNLLFNRNDKNDLLIGELPAQFLQMDFCLNKFSLLGRFMPRTPGILFHRHLCLSNLNTGYYAHVLFHFSSKSVTWESFWKNRITLLLIK